MDQARKPRRVIDQTVPPKEGMRGPFGVLAGKHRTAALHQPAAVFVTISLLLVAPMCGTRAESPPTPGQRGAGRVAHHHRRASNQRRPQHQCEQQTLLSGIGSAASRRVKHLCGWPEDRLPPLEMQLSLAPRVSSATTARSCVTRPDFTLPACPRATGSRRCSTACRTPRCLAAWAVT